MSNNKKLVIEIDADTGKFSAKLKELPNLIAQQADAAKQIKALDEARLGILQKNATLVKELQDRISTTVSKVKDLNDAFKLGAVNATLSSVNKQFSEVSKALENIAAKRKELDSVRQAQNFASTLGTLPAGADSSFDRRRYAPALQQGTVAEKRQAEAEAQFRLEEGVRLAHQQRDYNLVEAYAAKLLAKKKADNAALEAEEKAAAARNYESAKARNSFQILLEQQQAKNKSNGKQALYENLFGSAQAQATAAKASGATKTLDLTLQELRNTNLKVRDSNNELEKSHRTLFESVISSTLIYKTFTTALSGVRQALTDIPKAGIEAQATRSSIFGIFGSEQGLANLKFIREEALFAGQDIKVLEESYRKFAPSAVLAGEEQNKVNQTFKDFVETSSILHLTEQQVNSLFLALDQMYAKGVVQSEEIKKQLGNVLPGAVEIAARAFGKTPAAFMEAMKKNEVIAKEFVPKLAALYRQLFGGTDDKVFTTIQDQLNANLKRIKTNYDLLLREIFDKTSSVLNSSAKTISSALEGIINNLTGLGQAVELTSYLLAGRFTLALAEFVGRMGGITQAISKFSQVMTGMPLIFNASLGSLVAYYVHLNELSVQYNQATGFTITFQDKTVSLTSYIKSLAIITFDEFKSSIAGVTSELKALSGIDLSSFWDAIIPNKQDIADFLGYVNVIKNAIPSASGMKLVSSATDDEAFLAGREAFLNKLNAKQNKIMEAAGQKDAQAYAESFVGKSALEVSKAIAEGKLKTTEEITTALSKTIDIKAPNIAFGSENIPSIKPDKTALAARRKAITEEAKLENSEIKLALEKQQTLYNENIISYARYFEERKAILEKGIADEKALNRGKTGQAKIIDFEKQIEQLQQDRFSAAITKAQELRAIDQEYYQSIGDNEKAILSQQSEKYALIINYLKDQVELGNEAANEGLRRVKVAKELALLEAKNADAKLNIQANEAKYQQALERINILKNTGALSELQANREITKQNYEHIDQLNEAISLAEEELAVIEQQAGIGSTIYKKKAEEIRKMRGELENFKLTADATAQFIETTLGKSFDNAFASFVDGSQTAKQAFQSFSKSIISEIAKIAAQEVRSSVVSGLFKSIAGSLFGSGALTQSFSPASLPIGQAKGGINTGMGIGNGVVLSSATYFPNAKPTMFASGGVVAGEAGYEAALPLKRTRSGKLGVSVEGRETKGNVISINVNVERSKTMSDDQYAATIAEQIARRVAKEEITANNRNKSYISNATKYG